MRAASAPLARVLLLAALYVAVARLGLLLGAVHGFATLVWPASGLALAAVVARREVWPGVALGAFLVNAWIGAPWYVAAGIATGNTLEAVVGAYAVRRFAGAPRSIERVQDALGLVVCAAMLSTALAATLGVASLVVGHVVGAADAPETARAWWLGDALGDLVVGSLLLTWNEVSRPGLSRRRVAEAIAVGASVLGLGVWVFFGPATRTRADLFLESYLLFPPLVWAAVRFGLRGATATAFVVSVVAIAGTARGTGPFVRETLAGSLVHLQVFMALVSATGLVLGAAISERTRAVKSRDDVLAIVSHDLRNPLASLRMNVEASARGLARGSLESVSRQLVIANRAVDRMDGLVRDLVDLAAIDAGRLSLQPAAEDAWSLVREATETMRTVAVQGSIALEEAAAPAGTGTVVCDRQRVLQVFANLIGNAVKYTPAGGTVTIGSRLLEARVEFFVRDTGAGVAPEDLPHLFERYRRGTRNPHPGVGLGLFIAKTIVEAQGGEIEARTEVGVGSTFSFTLPRSQDAGAKPAGVLSNVPAAR